MSHIPSYIQAFVDESDTLSDQVMGNLNEISDNSESDRQKLNQKLKFKHKQTENIVSLNEESRYRQIVQQQSDLILRSLADTTITFANQSLCNTLGVELEQVIGQKWIDFGSPDDLQSILQNIALLSPEKPSFIAVNRDRRGDGQIGWTQWINRGIFNPQGQLVEIQSVGRDITALKLSELALKQLNEELELRVEQRTNALQQSESHLKTAQRIGKLGSWEFDLQTGNVIRATAHVS